MNFDEKDDDRVYVVVANDEEQYSIWLVDLPMPVGWKIAGKTGNKTECLAEIEEIWTDMRPLSLRKMMEQASAGPVN